MSDSTPDITQIQSAQSGKEITANRNINAALTMFGIEKIVGSTLYYIGGRFGGTHVNAGTVSLGYSATYYVVAKRADLTVSASTGTTNWNDDTTYGRIAKVVMGAASYTSWEDHRFGNTEAIFPMMAGGGGGGGGGGDMVLIDSIVVTGGSPSSVEFSSIAGDGKSLMIRVSCSDTNSGGSDYVLYMQFNGDSTAGNYSATTYNGFVSGSTAYGTIASTANGSVICNVAGIGSDASAMSSGCVEVPHYANTALKKATMSNTYRWYSSSAYGQLNFGFAWLSTAAITKITLTTSGSGFRNGSRFDLYMLM